MKLRSVCVSLILISSLLFLQVFGVEDSRENVIGEEYRRGTGNKQERFYNSFENYRRHPPAYPEYEPPPESLSAPGPYPSQYHHRYPDGYPSHGDGYLSGPGNYHHEHPQVYHSAPGGYHHQGQGHNALALKSLLIPLAGIALLGAAAALTTNPVLLQLGVVNGRRRKRSPDSLLSYPNQEAVS